MSCIIIIIIINFIPPSLGSSSFIQWLPSLSVKYKVIVDWLDSDNEINSEKYFEIHKYDRQRSLARVAVGSWIRRTLITSYKFEIPLN